MTTIARTNRREYPITVPALGLMFVLCPLTVLAGDIVRNEAGPYKTAPREALPPTEAKPVEVETKPSAAESEPLSPLSPPSMAEREWLKRKRLQTIVQISIVVIAVAAMVGACFCLAVLRVRKTAAPGHSPTDSTQP